MEDYIKGIKSFLKDAAKEKGKDLSDQEVNEILKTYNNDYDKIIDDVGTEFGASNEELTKFSDHIYKNYNLRPVPSQHDWDKYNKQEQQKLTQAGRPNAYTYDNKSNLPTINNQLASDTPQEIDNPVFKPLTPKKTTEQEINELKSIPRIIKPNFDIVDGRAVKNADDSNYLEDIGNSLLKGIATVDQGIVRLPATIYRVAALPQNLLAKIPGLESLEVNKKNNAVLKFLDENKITEFYDEEVKYWSEKVIKYERSAVEQFKKGDIVGGLKTIGAQATEAIPLTMLLMIPGGPGAATEATVGMLAYGTGQKMHQIDQENPDMDEVTKTVNSLFTGGFEAYSERFGSIGIGKTIGRKLLAKKGKDALKETAKGAFLETMGSKLLPIYNISSPMIQEGLSEAASQYAENYVDWITGKEMELNPMKGVFDNFLVGFAAGGTITSPVSVYVEIANNVAPRIKLKKDYTNAAKEIETLSSPDYANAITRLAKTYNNNKELSQNFESITDQYIDQITDQDYQAAKNFLIQSFKMDQVNKIRKSQIDKEISDFKDNQGNITTTEINGQRWSIRNPEDLGKENKAIFVKSPHGTVRAFMSSIVKQWETKSPEDIKNEALSEQDAQDEGMASQMEPAIVNEQEHQLPNGDIVNIAQLDNGQVKINLNGEEQVFNTPEEMNTWFLEQSTQIEQEQAQQPQEEEEINLDEIDLDELTPQEYVNILTKKGLSHEEINEEILFEKENIEKEIQKLAKNKPASRNERLKVKEELNFKYEQLKQYEAILNKTTSEQDTEQLLPGTDNISENKTPEVSQDNLQPAENQDNENLKDQESLQKRKPEQIVGEQKSQESAIPEGLNEDEFVDWVLENSDNPQDIIAAHETEQRNIPINKLSPWQEDMMGRKVKKKDVISQVGKNKVDDNEYSRFWYGGKSTLDQIAQELTAIHNVEVTEQDIIDLMDQYPNGYARKTTNRQTELEDKFKAVTGFTFNQRQKYFEQKEKDGIRISENKTKEILNDYWTESGFDTDRLYKDTYANRKEFQNKYGITDVQLSTLRSNLKSNSESFKKYYEKSDNSQDPIFGGTIDTNPNNEAPFRVSTPEEILMSLNKGTDTKIVILDSIDDLPDFIKNHPNFPKERFDGAYIASNNTAYFIKGKITSKGKAIDLWVHEIGAHAGLTKLLPNKQLRNQFFDHIWREANNLANNDPEIARIINHIKQSYGNNSSILGEEFLAYYAEKYVSKNGVPKLHQSFWESILSKFKEILEKTFNFDSSLTRNDLDHIIKTAILKNYEHSTSNKGASTEISFRQTDNTNGSQGRTTEQRYQMDTRRKFSEPTSTDIRQGRVLSGMEETGQAEMGSRTRQEQAAQISVSAKSRESLKYKSNTLTGLEKITSKLNIPVNIVHSSETDSDKAVSYNPENASVQIIADKTRSAVATKKDFIKEIVSNKGVEELFGQKERKKFEQLRNDFKDNPNPENDQNYIDRLTHYTRRAFGLTSKQFSQNDLKDILTNAVKNPIFDQLTSDENGSIYTKESYTGKPQAFEEGISFKSEEALNNTPKQHDLWEEKNYVPGNNNTINDETWVERKSQLLNGITFSGEPLTGAPHIRSSKDVAFLFKNLENSATENAFAVLIKPDGQYQVFWHSHGSTSATVIDVKLILASAKEYGASKVCLVHNHPSGSLQQSDADKIMHTRLNQALNAVGIKLMPSVIINLDSGKYVEFTSGKYDIKDSPENSFVGASKQEVYTFDQQILYKPSNTRTKIGSSKDVAEFLSKSKRSSTPKVGALILDRQNTIVKAMLFDETTTPEKLKSDILYNVSKHGETVILHSNKNLPITEINALNRALNSLSSSILDVVISKQEKDIIENYESWADNGKLLEPATKYNNSENNTNFETNKHDEVPKSVPQAKFRAQNPEDARIEKFSNYLRRGNETTETTGSTIQELRNKEAQLAYNYAKENNIWFPDIYDLGQPFSSGNENTVVVNTDEKTVFKSNNLLNTQSISGLINQVKLHNQFFPETRYDLIGFTGFENKNKAPYIEVILKQGLVENSELATTDEIASYMKSIGFNKQSETSFTNRGITISDLYPRNVLKDKDGDIFVVDNIISSKADSDQNNVRFKTEKLSPDREYLINSALPDPSKIKTRENVADYNTRVEIINKLYENDMFAEDFINDMEEQWVLEQIGEKRYFEEIVDEKLEELPEELEYTIEKYLDETDIPLNLSIEDLAIQAKGITDYLVEAGYILSDGRLLDFSGKRFGAEGGERIEDHRQLGIPYKEDVQSPTDTMYAFMRTTGAIRMDYNSGSIDIETKPTPEQRRIISKIIRRNPDTWTVDLADGSRKLSLEGGPVETALNNIDRFFKDETLGTGYNDIIRFRTDNFYSPTEQALSKIKQEKGTPQQFKAMLLKNGAKQAELDWMGWDEHFKPISELDYKLDNNNSEYFVRYSNNIEDDIKRGWSSWNFGGDGFSGTQEELLDYINNYKGDGGDVSISGFNIWVDNESNISSDNGAVYLNDYEFRELYPEYWVAVDRINSPDGLSAHVLPDNLDTTGEAFNEMKNNLVHYDGTGDGQSFDPSEAKILYSGIQDGKEFHIIEVGRNKEKQPTNTITKADIQEWIDGNKVEIKEVQKAASNRYSQSDIKDATIDYSGSGYWVVSFNNELDDISFPLDQADDKNEAYTYALDQANYSFEGDNSSKPKYSQWQLPGGENYRELLLTMPQKPISKPYEQWLKENFYGEDRPEARKLYAQQIEPNEPNFKSSHFDEPNILAHIRFNERTDKDGNRVLFLEEIQSDFSQSLKKKHDEYYNLLKTNPDAIIDKYKKSNKLEVNGKYLTREEFLEWAGNIDFKEVGDILPEFKHPQTPFKQTDQWVNLAFRRMLRYAAENGFDKVAWTTGEQQADRYDLSKQVDRIQATKNNNKSYDLRIYPRASSLQRMNVKDDTELENTIGKDLAKKISNQEVDKLTDYDGIDLKVGGEGMKAFYDKIVPSQAKKVGKPFKASPTKTQIDIKPEVTDDGINLESGEVGEQTDGKWLTVQALPVTESMREPMPMFRVVHHGTGNQFDKLEFRGENGAIHEFFGNAVFFSDNYDTAKYYKEEAEFETNKTGRVISVDIPENLVTKIINANKRPMREVRQVFNEIRKGGIIKVTNIGDANLAGAQYSESVPYGEKPKNDEYKYPINEFSLDYSNAKTDKEKAKLTNTVYDILDNVGISHKKGTPFAIKEVKLIEKINPEIKFKHQFRKTPIYTTTYIVAGKEHLKKVNDLIPNSPDIRFKIDKAATDVNLSPTDQQKAAGNYKKGHVRFDGLDISIENPKGSTRSGTDKGGQKWERELPADYGYFRGTVGKDKDHIDVFIGENPESDKVYVVDQLDTDTGKFDEHKIMVGFNNISEARKTYLAAYEPGWQGLGDISRTDKKGLKDWFNNGNTKKPFTDNGIRFKISSEEFEKFNESFKRLIESGAVVQKIEQIKKEMGDKSLADVTYEKIKQEINSIKEGARAGRKDMKAEINAVQSKLSTYARKNMPLDAAGQRDIWAILTALKNTQSPKSLEKALNKIDDISKKIETKSLLNRFDKLLNKKHVKSQSGKPTGTINPDILESLEKIKAIRSMTEEQFEKYADNLEDDSVEDIALASIFANLDERTPDEIRDAINKLKQIISEGKIWYKEQHEKRKSSDKRLREQAIETITGGEGIKSDQDLIASNKEPKDGTIKHFLSRQQSLEWLLDWISNNKSEDTGHGWMQEYFGDSLNKSTNAENKGMRETIEMINEKASEIFGKGKHTIARVFAENSKKIKKSGVTYQKDGERVEIPLSQNQAYKRWMEMQDPTLRETFQEQGWDDISLSQLEDFIKPDVMQWAMWQLYEFYPAYYEGVNEAYRAAYYTNLPHNPLYSPIKREVTATGDKDDALLRPTNIMSSVAGRSLKSRVRNKHHIQITDGDSVLAGHIAEMEHFKAWVETIRELRSVISGRDVQAAIKKTSGNSVRTSINDRINSLARGGADRREVNHLLDKIRANFVTSALGLNLTLLPKQLVSVGAYLNDLSIPELMEGYAAFIKHPARAIKAMNQSELINNRYKKGWTHEIEAALKRSNPNLLAGSKGFMNQLRDLLMIATKLGDRFGIFGGYPIYHKFYNEYKSKNPDATEQEIHNFAMNKFERIVARTQQSSEIKDTSRIQEGSVGKLFTMFKNAQQLYFRYEMAAIRNLIKGRGNTAKNIKILATTHVLLPMAFQAISNLFTDEDDKTENMRLLRSGILGSWNGLLIAGDIIEYGLEKAMGEEWGFSLSPVLDTGESLGLSIAKLRKAAIDNSAEDLWEGIDYLAEFTSSTMTGIPYEPLKKHYKTLTGEAKGEKALDKTSRELNDIIDNSDNSNVFQAAKDLKYKYSSIKAKATRFEKDGNIMEAERLRKIVDDSKIKMADTDFTLADINNEIEKINYWINK